MNEINTLKTLDHPNIVKVFEYFEDERNFYIVTESIEGGELFDEIVKRGNFDEKNAAIIMKGLLSCIGYCHDRGVIHRDLKPENVLIETNAAYDDIKIIDFGIAQAYKQGDEHVHTCIGTPYYIAPEVLNKDYDNLCDIWSLGVIAYIILSGIPPFNGSNDRQIQAAIKKGEFDFAPPVFNKVSQEAKDFISSLLTFDAKKRPDAHVAIKHPWIVKFGAKSNEEEELQRKNSRVALDNLGGFHSENQMKSACMSFIGSQLISKQEREELAKVFKLMDDNGDGKIDKDEIKRGYMNIHGKLISDDEVNKMFAAVDTDGSGYIDYTEFVTASMNEKELMTKDRLAGAFKLFDKDGSGAVTPQEIRDVLSA